MKLSRFKKTVKAIKTMDAINAIVFFDMVIFLLMRYGITRSRIKIIILSLLSDPRIYIILENKERINPIMIWMFIFLFFMKQYKYEKKDVIEKAHNGFMNVKLLYMGGFPLRIRFAYGIIPHGDPYANVQRMTDIKPMRVKKCIM